MAIFRGIGGAGDSTTDATVTAVTEQAVNAATSATQAASSASSAASSASSASTSATNAAASASTASDAATAAQTAQTNAETAETNAETAETNAETAETNAAASASSASTSATNASNSATAASNSATAASNSASAAATSATNAENAYDSFDDRYLGVKASDPALDNDGAALLTGALYFNSTDNEMRVYTGSVWIAVVDLAGDVTVTSLTASSVDINGGTIDGVTIATSNITVGAGKTLDVSAGTLTLANDQISGDKIDGGTIGSTIITTLTSTTGNITTVNATTVDTTNIEVTNVKAKDGTASASIADSTGVMTIASAVLTTADINAGTIDDTVIGGSTAAAGTFTTATTTTGVVTDTISERTATSGVTIDGVVLKDNGITATGGGSLTGTWSDLGSVTTIDINGGTIDGVTIGGASAGAITGTTITGTQFSSDATDVELKYSGSTKLSTTNTGIDVTGTVTADGLTVDGDATLQNISGSVLLKLDGSTYSEIRMLEGDTTDANSCITNNGGQLTFQTLAEGGTTTNRFQISHTSGDVKFYDDTGTSQNFYWDASTSRLGLGTTSPEAPLEVAYTTSAPSLEESDAGFLLSANNSLRTMFGADPSSPFAHWIQVTNSSGSAAFPLALNPQGGNVGIGTTSPDTVMEVVSNDPILTIRDSSTALTNASSTLRLAESAADDALGSYWDVALDGSGGTIDFTIGNNTSEAMRIDSLGNVGIGTTSPSQILEIAASDSPTLRITNTDATLVADQVIGAIEFKGNDSSEDGSDVLGAIKLIATDATPDSELVFYTHRNQGSVDDSITERMRIDNSGNVGIGTTDPASLFHISSGGPTITITDTTFNADATITVNDAGSLTFSADANNERASSRIQFDVDGSEVARIDSVGRLGIGTTSPLSYIHIAQSVVAIRMEDTDNDSYGMILYNTADGGLRLRSDQNQATGTSGSNIIFETDASEAMRIDSSGNLLVGGTETPTSSVGNFVLYNGTAPTGNATNGVILYAEDVSASSELKVRDEAGNVTTLSPHNFNLIPEGPSEDMAWSYYSERDGKRINVDMLKAIRLLEQLTGEKLVHTS